MRNPDKLRVTQAAEDFAVLVYEYTRAFPREERWGLTAHARKTAISIGSSVFEACGRLTNKGFVASLGVAHGEANEMLFQSVSLNALASASPLKHSSSERSSPICNG